MSKRTNKRQVTQRLRRVLKGSQEPVGQVHMNVVKHGYGQGPSKSAYGKNVQHADGS